MHDDRHYPAPINRAANPLEQLASAARSSRPVVVNVHHDAPDGGYVPGPQVPARAFAAGLFGTFGVIAALIILAVVTAIVIAFINSPAATVQRPPVVYVPQPQKTGEELLREAVKRAERAEPPRRLKPPSPVVMRGTDLTSPRPPARLQDVRPNEPPVVITDAAEAAKQLALTVSPATSETVRVVGTNGSASSIGAVTIGVYAVGTPEPLAWFDVIDLPPHSKFDRRVGLPQPVDQIQGSLTAAVVLSPRR